MPKKLNCPSCGSNLKPDAYYCDYCGAFFEKQKNVLEEEQFKRFESKENKEPVLPKVETEDLYKDDHFVSDEEIENSRLNSILISYNNIKENNGVTGILFAILFFFIFTSGIFIEAPFLSILIVIVLSGVINGQKEKKKELVMLYQKGAYEKAYKKLAEMPTIQHNLNVIKQKIMLCYYRLNKKEEAKNLIELLNAKPHIKDVHILEVAQKLNVVYEPKV
ncbi:MAG: hypothetical protein CVV59_01590 [Tenericutes bacterium HGW-Tenericutes-4]|nr:MAG: hypothetical protein CVV59_01590 [Tenericutes bacterium HGW-Tenericutes-4]